MKTITVEDKIESIKLGIRIQEMKRKELQVQNSKSNLCDRVNIIKEIDLIDMLIRNMKYRIDQLEVNQW